MCEFLFTTYYGDLIGLDLVALFVLGFFVGSMIQKTKLRIKQLEETVKERKEMEKEAMKSILKTE